MYNNILIVVRDVLGIGSPADLINAINSHLGTVLVKEFGYIYKFVMTGEASLEASGIFYLDLKNGKLFLVNLH